MSERLRGLEVTIRFSVDGSLLGGTFVKCTDFTITPRDELPETDFIGEDESDIDYRHDGFDFSGSFQELDRATRQYLALLVFNHEQHIAPPDVTMMVDYGYRDGITVLETFRKCRMKIDETTIGSRKDYVTCKVSGKAKKYTAATEAA